MLKNNSKESNLNMRIKDLDAFGPTFLIFVFAVISLTVLFGCTCSTERTPQPEVNEDSVNRFSPVYWNTIVIPSLMRTAPTPPIR
jgi:hypothetical protein